MDMAQAHGRDRAASAGARGEPVEHCGAFLGALDQQVERLKLVEIAIDEMRVLYQRLGELLDQHTDMAQFARHRAVQRVDQRVVTWAGNRSVLVLHLKPFRRGRSRRHAQAFSAAG